MNKLSAARRAVTWERAGRSLQLLPADVTLADALAQRNGLHEMWRMCPREAYRIRSLLLDFVVSDLDCQKLRQATDELGSLARKEPSRDELISAAAEVIVQRRMTMLEGIARHAGAVKSADGAAAASQEAQRTVTPSQLRSHGGTATAAATRAPQVEDNFIDSLAHDLQASVLKKAALSGMPICELCEKAKAEASRSPSRNAEAG